MPSTPYVWSPSAEVVDRANVTRLMRRRGVADYGELVRWSQEDIETFWDTVVEDLGIEFARPYDATLDVSAGVEWPRWFEGGRINLGHNCVRRHAVATPGHTAVVAAGESGEDRHVSYAELDRLVAQAADGLHRLGVREGDRVALYLPLDLDAVVGLYACAYLGAVAVPMFSGFSATAIADRLRDADCKALLTAVAASRRGRRVPMLDVAIEACAGVEITLVARADGGDLPDGVLSWAAELERAGRRAPAELPSEAPVLVVYTSGTTGAPKGSVHVHGGFLVKAGAEVAYHLDVQADDVVQWVTDLGWILGPWHLVGAHLAGATVVLYAGAPDFPAEDRVWDLYERHGVTVAGVSPTLVRALAAHGEEPVRRHDLSRLRILGSTGEPWDPGSYHWLFETVGGGRCPIINVSGGTEVGACFLGQVPVMPAKACSLGAPSLGMAVDVYDSDGRPVRGEMGELVCTKPWPGQTRGFLNAAERYLDTYWRTWPGVWAHGDWASVDEDGCWFLHGRSDDTLKIAGKRLGPSEVEAAALTQPAVAECVAVGIPDPVKGEVVWCVCTTTADGAEEDRLVAAVRGAVAGALGKAFAPARVVVVPDLPRTRSGKLVRRLVRDRLLGRAPGDTSALANPEALDAIAPVAA